MTKLNEIYRCEICGNIVELAHPGVGQLICCGEHMKLLEAKTQDEGSEKHVPVIERIEGGFKVKIGSVPHPMEDRHYIEFIEVLADDKVYRRYLKPGQTPEAEFKLVADRLTVREYCNVHGLWKKEQ